MKGVWKSFVFWGIGVGVVVFLMVVGLEISPREIPTSSDTQQEFSGTLLQPVPIDLSRAEKSCTRQQKKGGFPDGLGGAGFPEIFFQEGQLMIGNWQEDVFNSRPFDWENGEDVQWYRYSGAREALELAAKTNLLETLRYQLYDDGQLHCLPADKDCKIAYEAGAWSDGQGNYFVAGYQKGSDELVYLINGKLYTPSHQKDSLRSKDILYPEKGIIANSHWFFGGIQDWKLFIKRYLDYKYTGWIVEVALNDWVQNRLTSTYTLETCELVL